ncbi:MAG: hypothetical protein JNL26_03825 [Gemmatimonadetes bacterium]|nr:hypothetical protein [Gemmatimonadota bacterium]
MIVRFVPLIAAALLAGCGDSLSRWGSDLPAARRGADEAAAAFVYRFTNVSRDSMFAAARPLMGQYALAPSKLFRDSSLWTIRGAPDSSQALYLNATLERDSYRFRAVPMAPYPAALGEERHYIRLRKVTPSTYEWITIVDHGVGTAPAASFANGLRAFVTAFQGKSGPQVRRDLARTLPLSSRQFGRLFRIDSLVTTTTPDGATLLTVDVVWQPDSLRRNAPSFAAWVDRYVMPSDFTVTLVDRQGARYLSAAGTPGRMRLVVRAHGGRWVALSGAPNPMPDTLEMHADASMKFKIFRVGFRRLVGTLAFEHDDHLRGLAFRWQREPEWRFPLAANQLIRTPLRTPFAGRGIELRLGFRDDLGRQTMSLRHVRLVVHESAIMRWLGGLSATAFGEYEGQTETEENRFLAACFEALRRDIAAIAP